MLHVTARTLARLTAVERLAYGKLLVDSDRGQGKKVDDATKKEEE